MQRERRQRGRSQQRSGRRIPRTRRWYFEWRRQALDKGTVPGRHQRSRELRHGQPDSRSGMGVPLLRPSQLHRFRGEQPKAHQGGTCTEFGLMRRSFLLVSDASPPHESAGHVSIGWEWGERGDMTRFVKLASVHVHVFGCPICPSLNYRKKTILTPHHSHFFRLRHAPSRGGQGAGGRLVRSGEWLRCATQVLRVLVPCG